MPDQAVIPAVSWTPRSSTKSGRIGRISVIPATVVNDPAALTNRLRFQCVVPPSLITVAQLVSGVGQVLHGPECKADGVTLIGVELAERLGDVSGTPSATVLQCGAAGVCQRHDDGSPVMLVRGAGHQS